MAKINSITQTEAIALQNICPGVQNGRVGERLKYDLDEIGPIGTAYYLDPANGNDNSDGLTVETAKATFAAAYALLTANKNDVLYLIGNNSGLTLPAAITWAKRQTKISAVCGPPAAIFAGSQSLSEM